MREGRSSIWQSYLVSLGFFSRLPVYAYYQSRLENEFFQLKRHQTGVPLAGLTLGVLISLFAAALMWAHIPPIIIGPLLVVVFMLLTGALHEDGLADCADGFGGGQTLERKLEIMKDSAVGSYGALALIASFGLRAGLYGLILSENLISALIAISLIAALSRGCSLALSTLLPLVRKGGIAAGVGQLALKEAMPLFITMSALILGAMLIVGSTGPILVIAISCLFGALVMGWIAKQQIGGITGDVFGAAQQFSEIFSLIVLASYAPYLLSM